MHDCRLQHAMGHRFPHAGQLRCAWLHAETVKYFGNEKLEVAKLGTAVEEYQVIEFKLMASLAALNVLQSGIIFAGLAGGLILCVKVQPALAQQFCKCPLSAVRCDTSMRDADHAWRLASVRKLLPMLSAAHAAPGPPPCLHRLSEYIRWSAGCGRWQSHRGRCGAIHSHGAAAERAPQLLWQLLPLHSVQHD